MSAATPIGLNKYGEDFGESLRRWVEGTPPPTIGEEPGSSGVFQLPVRSEEFDLTFGYEWTQPTYSEEQTETLRLEANEWLEYYKLNDELPYPSDQLITSPQGQGWAAANYRRGGIQLEANIDDPLAGAGGGIIPYPGRLRTIQNPYYLHPEAAEVHEETLGILEEAGLRESQLQAGRESRGIGTDYMGKRDAAARQGLVNRQRRAIMLSEGI